MNYLQELKDLLYPQKRYDWPAAYLLLDDAYKADGKDWDSLLINRRKPYTYRMFTSLPVGRLCLHKFDPCGDNEAFYHPHPWPGAFVILKGAYKMTVGLSPDRTSKPETVMESILHAGSFYQIDNPMTWHKIQPLTTTYTMMLNGMPWDADYAHTEVRTTKGKDLGALDDTTKLKHLRHFRDMVYRFHRKYRFSK